MGNFNYIDFVTTQKHKLNDEFITNLVLEHLVKDYLNNNNIILEGQLDEGIKDFVQKIKTKIKGSKLAKFGELLKLLKQSRKPQAVISFLTVLRNLKLNLLDPEVVLAAFSIIAGTTNLNEVTKSIPKEKYDDTAKKLEPSLAALKKYFEEKAFGAILKIFLLAAPIFAMNADDIGKTLDAMGGNYKGQTVNPNQVNPEGFQSPNTIALDDAIDMIDDSSPDGGEDGASGTSGVIGVDLENINAAEEQGLDINEKEGQDVSFYKYANGESVTTSQHNQQFSAENSSIINLMEEGDSYSSVVKGFSSNTGDAEADKDNKGGSVSANRGINMSSDIIEDFESQLNERGIKYEKTSSGDVIKITLENGATYTHTTDTTSSNPGDFKVIDGPSDDEALQSAIRMGEPSDTPMDAKTLFGIDVARKEPSERERDTKPLAPVSVEEFSGLVRDAQWAVIMAVINPEANIFPYLNDDGSSEVKGGYTSSNFEEGETNYLLDNAPENIKKLARGLVGARKGPDKVIGKIGNILGIKFDKRAKAIFNVSGAEKGKGQERPSLSVSENIFHPFKDLLSEAASDLLDDFFIDSNIKSNASNIIAKLGSMYARKGDYLGIINPEKLDSKTQEEIKDFGFTQITTGRDSGKYIFLDDPEDAKAVSAAGDTKLTPDVDRVKKTMDRQPTLKNLFNRINTKKELEELLFYMVDYVGPKFQEQKSQMKGALIRLSQDKNLEQKPLIRQALRAAANRIATDKKTSTSTSTTSTTAGSDIEIDYTIPGSAIRESVLKNLIKQSIKEVIKEQQLEIPFPDDIQKDTENLLNIFKNNSTLQSQLDQINVLKEFEELIRELVINTALFKQK